MRIETESTICAIATGDVGAVRGVVRITGPDTIQHLGGLFADLEESLKGLRRPTALESSVVLDGLGSVPVVVHCWPTHRSYTGQPSAELHALGAPIVLQEILAALLERGIRLAQPGEFTLRAYLAGRMDLTQCEAVLGLIHATGERAFQVALSQLAGGLAEPLKRLRRDLIDLVADLEAGLDFVDEDIEFIASEQVIVRLERALEALRGLREQLRQRAGQGTAFQVSVVGLPNAGKSSLVNALSGTDVAITSEVPGTTRDYVRSRIQGEGWVLDILDTAGLEETALEESGVSASPDGAAQAFTQEQLRQADLILYCSSSATGGEEDDRNSLDQVLRDASSEVWWVGTKQDLGAVGAFGMEVPHMRTFRVSSKTGEGVSELLAALVERMKRASGQAQDVVPMTGERCRESLELAAERIQEGLSAARHGAGDEVIAGELRLALDELGQVAGDVVQNDILDALFSRFCIGK
jgi:tRNA modification GTPase